MIPKKKYIEIHEPGRKQIEARLMELMKDEQVSSLSDNDIKDIAKNDIEFPKLKAFIICIVIVAVFQLRWIPVIKHLFLAVYTPLEGFFGALGDAMQQALSF